MNPAFFVAGVVGVVMMVLASGEASPAHAPGRHFTWADFTRSTAAKRLGLDNTPTPEARAAIRVLVRHVLDPLVDALGRPVRVTSGYRSPAVNRAVGGVADSQHMRGEAADIKVDGLTAEQLAAVIVRLRLPVRQALAYAPERGGHLHVAITATALNPRPLR